MANLRRAAHPSTPRCIRVRHRADAPPLPLGCRWCGHPPYAHDAASLPHRALHLYEPPTRTQMDARMRTRRRLGLCRTFPAAPSRPLNVHPPVISPRPGRHARPAAAAAHGLGRAPDTPYPPPGRRARGAAA